MNTDNVIKYAELLHGITYRDWKLLKIGIDRAFESDIRNYERTLKISDTEDVKLYIQSQFGGWHGR